MRGHLTWWCWCWYCGVISPLCRGCAWLALCAGCAWLLDAVEGLSLRRGLYASGAGRACCLMPVLASVLPERCVLLALRLSYLVDLASRICLSQRLSHACVRSLSPAMVSQYSVDGSIQALVLVPSMHNMDSGANCTNNTCPQVARSRVARC